MQRIFSLILFLFLALGFRSQAQLEKVIVETYYISDDSDATDTTGSVLRAHSTTYRIYIDMAKGYKLIGIYGDVNHTFSISSDSVFYNHTLDGQTFGYSFNITHYNEGTLPLDTYLTLGQVSTSKPKAKTYFGLLKTEDKNGSLIGGTNSDGGSKPVSRGLLVNNDPAAGIPLTVGDGMDTMGVLPSSWQSSGVIDFLGNDSTIFGSLKRGTSFSSNNFYLQNNGVTGINRDSNQVLIAQLTTRGKLKFQLNVKIGDSLGNTLYCVAKNGADSLTAGVTQNSLLNYPLPCGCNNPNYLEFNPYFVCLDSSACKIKAVLGCMDPEACNYDPTANINVQELCCYPGNCNYRDISLVCPDLSVNTVQNEIRFEIYPNPATNLLNFILKESGASDTGFELFDAFGKLLLRKNVGSVVLNQSVQLDLSGFPAGLYSLRLFQNNASSVKKFLKFQ